jgi:diadenosine tetraphosphate (Ap4A) HIT family hydrolase
VAGAVVPNRYPAFEGEDSMAVHNLGPVHVQADASGIHEVIILSPDHTESWKDLDDDAAAMVMSALRNRMAEQSRHANIRYTQAIVNQGREAGASLTHPHGQLLGMPFVPVRSPTRSAPSPASTVAASCASRPRRSWPTASAWSSPTTTWSCCAPSGAARPTRCW